MTVIVPTSTFKLAGTIVAEDGSPIVNAGVDVVSDGIWPGCLSWTIVGPNGSTVGGGTDASGRYQLALECLNGSLPGQFALWLETGKEGYVQQCMARTTVTGNSGTLDGRLTSIANLSTTHPISDPDSRTLSGIVFETTTTGRRPIPGVTVGYYAFFDESYGEAYTLTDAAGFYSLCNLPQTSLSSTSDPEAQPGFYAYKEGYLPQSPLTVEAGTGDVTLDIELKKRN